MNKRLIILLGICLLLVGCGKSKEIEPGKITCDQMSTLMSGEVKPVLIDVRTKEEYDEGHLDGAINIPVDSVGEEVPMNKSINPIDTPVIVYCKSGKRSAQAYETLKEAGYKKIYDLGAMNNCK